jgi:hypothetical protein
MLQRRTIISSLIQVALHPGTLQKLRSFATLCHQARHTRIRRFGALSDIAADLPMRQPVPGYRLAKLFVKEYDQ